MGLSVTLVSGPQGSGKSTLVNAFLGQAWESPPHYIRMVKSGAAGLPLDQECPACDGRNVASKQYLGYDDDRVFEVLPEVFTDIHKRDRFGAVVVEADADPVLRHAYPYDYRLFIMAMPATTQTVFRDSRHAAKELRRVLDDTAAFASEIYGLFDDPRQVDVEPHEKRSGFSHAGMRGLLHSPLGDELATRIQLQPDYHGLVESDIVVVNTAIGVRGPQTPECLRRVEKLFARLKRGSDSKGRLFLCDPVDFGTSRCRKLLKALESMCHGGS